MTQEPKVPYRAPDAQPTKRTAPPSFERAWEDAEAAGEGWAIWQLTTVCLLLSVLLTVTWRPLGFAAFGATAAWVWRRLRRRAPSTVRAAVNDTGLTVRFGDEVMLTTTLDALHNIEVDSTAVQRVTYHQNVGDPMPGTQVSGDVRVARLTARMADGTAHRLTTTATHYDACMESFGKLRVFLRAHGWKPVDER